MVRLEEVLVPNLGEYKNVPVIEVFVIEGDQVEKEAPLVTLESDKATMDVPSPAAGRINDLMVVVGDTVSSGDVIMVMEVEVDNDEEKTSPPPSAAQQQLDLSAVTSADRPSSPAGDNDGLARGTQEPAASPEPTAGDAESGGEPPPTGRLDRRRAPPTTLPAAARSDTKPHASPAVRRFARELGCDLRRIRGTGRKGRILKEDIQAFVKQALARSEADSAGLPAVEALPDIDFAKFGDVEIQPLNRIRRLSAAHLHRSWVHIPHVTHHDEADITDLEEFRQHAKDEAAQKGVRLTMLAFLMKASVTALKKYPDFNASLANDGENLVVKKYYHVGIAVDTPEGLVVPVVRNVDRKGILDLAGELGEIGERARAGKLTPEDLQGGTFTISSLGGIGGVGFTPIINAPEVAILGVSRARRMPIYKDEDFVARLILPLSLSYDHRVIDGAAAARFTAYLTRVLGDARLLLL